MKKRIPLLMMIIFIFGFAFAPTLPVKAETDVVELNSGAPRNGEFISVNEEFPTSYGTLMLVMSGLKIENKDLLLSALGEYFDAEGNSGLKVIDDAFADAEKWDVNSLDAIGYDVYQCWAASAANMLWVSGWASGLVNPDTGTNFSSEDEVFAYYNENFTDQGCEIDRGIDWFFMGEFYVSDIRKHTNLKHPDRSEDGLMKSFVSSLIQQKYDLTADPADISQLERIAPDGGSPAVFQASVGPLDEGEIYRSIHSVTAAGVIIDPKASSIEERYKGIAIIDSDNDAKPSEQARQIEDPTLEQKKEDKAARLNSCTFYPLKYIYDINGTPCWEIAGYSENETEILYAINALELPGEELIAKCTETEGNCSAADTVDLTLDSVITTAENDPIIDYWSYSIYGDEYICTEFQVNQPVNLNYFVTNRTCVVLDESYTKGSNLTVGWSVKRDADGVVVSEGTDIFKLPLYSRIEMGAMIYLNRQDDTIASWEPGVYTVTVSLNPDRAVREAYYLNNIDQVLKFIITDSGEQGDVTPTQGPTKTPTAKPTIQPTQGSTGTPDTGDVASKSTRASLIALIISGIVLAAALRKVFFSKG